MKRLWLLVGIPGSGKSTWIKNHRLYFSDKYAAISRDKIRFSLLKENDDYFSKEDQVWKEYLSQTISSLLLNEDTILDATHLNEKSRSKILRALKNYLIDFEINAIVINTSLNEALKRNDNRTGREFVPKAQIRRMAAQMTIPTIEEGFDHIYIFNDENKKVKYQIIEKGG